MATGSLLVAVLARDDAARHGEMRQQRCDRRDASQTGSVNLSGDWGNGDASGFGCLAVFSIDDRCASTQMAW